MKKIFLSILFCVILVGCGKKDEKGILKELEKKINKSNSYYLEGTLEMISNENSYMYDVSVSYEKEEKFKVNLNNQTSNHKQIILKNADGVYVLTPSLNKSFKFQSDWPYNNSQSYMLQTLLKDIKNDDNRKFEKNNNEYIYTVKANYSNNGGLVNQKIYLNKNLEFTKVEVLDENEVPQIKMTFKTIEFDKKFDNNHFTLNGNVEETDVTDTTGKIDEIIYPMYLPANTTLTSQDKITKTNGERIILTFSGDKPFTFVQETVVAEEELVTILMDGDPLLLCDSVASLSDNSITWISNGIEYYIVSKTLTTSELLQIASSISTMPVMK